MPPDTTLGGSDHPDSYDNGTNATFEFSSGEADPTFECKLDDGAFEACASPKSYDALEVGRHTFGVRATGAAGNVDPTPVEYAWEIDQTSR